jgi:hypothetical protein
MKTMNRVQKILVDYSKFTNQDLLDKANTIIACLTGNPEIPTPSPTIAVLQAGVDDLRSAVTAANTGGKADREIRDEKRVDLITLLKQEAQYVTLLANGNVATMLNAGFDVSKIPSPIGPLPKPVKFQVSSPKKGWLQLSLKAIKGAKTYFFEYKKVGEEQWKSVPSSKARLIIMGLESTVLYVARVMPKGASIDTSYSDEITGTVI